MAFVLILAVLAVPAGLELLRPGAPRWKWGLGAALCAAMPGVFGGYFLSLAPRVPDIAIAQKQRSYPDEEPPVAPHLAATDLRAPPREQVRLSRHGRLCWRGADATINQIAARLSRTRDAGRGVQVLAHKDAPWLHLAIILHEATVAGFDEVTLVVRKHADFQDSDEELADLGLKRGRWLDWPDCYLQIPLSQETREGPVLGIRPWRLEPRTVGSGVERRVLTGFRARYRIGDRPIANPTELMRRIAEEPPAVLEIHPGTPLKYVVAAMDHCVALGGSLPRLRPFTALSGAERTTPLLPYPRKR